MVLLCTAAAVLPASAQTASANEIKAAYLFNFARFIDWPEELFTAQSSMVFCTLGRSAVADELDSSLHGKSINNRMAEIRHLRGPEEFAGCHIVFIAASAEKQQQKLLQATKGAPILLVAETPGFARAGGTINFIIENRRLIFEINIRAAESAHLRISSKLLAIARIISPAGEKRGRR
jgi:hypothetical protein